MNNITKSKTIVESCYKQVRADIVHNVHKPGSKLLISDLRDMYDVGAGPLREALSRLAGEGLVVTESQRGFQVSKLSKHELEDLTHVRVLLECESLRDSIKNGDDEWEVKIVAAFHRLTMKEGAEIIDFDGWESCNRAFHDSIVAACKSPWLLRFRGVLFENLTRYRFLEVNSNDVVPRNLHSEHEIIKDAVIARDADAACEAVTQHILGTLDTNKYIISDDDDSA